jgi:hypothetical protein
MIAITDTSIISTTPIVESEHDLPAVFRTALTWADVHGDTYVTVRLCQPATLNSACVTNLCTIALAYPLLKAYMHWQPAPSIYEVEFEITCRALVELL